MGTTFRGCRWKGKTPSIRVSLCVHQGYTLAQNGTIASK